MIEENYVSFELAKMLKEKGFDEPTMSFFRGDKIIWQEAFYPTDIRRPTLQLAQKWLRETYEFDICVVPTLDKDNYKAYYYLVIDIQHHIQEKSGLYEDYDNCWGDAIKYCLENLI